MIYRPGVIMQRKARASCAGKALPTVKPLPSLS